MPPSSRPITRRSLTRGAVWAAPSAAVAVVAPVLAVSCAECTEPGSVLADYSSPGTYSLALDPCIGWIHVDVRGAAGGPNTIAPTVPGRYASRLEADLLLAVPTTLTLIVGATGRSAGTSMADASHPWSQGYGNGGEPGAIQEADGPHASGGGGGGGSAIFRGAEPMFIAGGGGGDGGTRYRQRRYRPGAGGVVRVDPAAPAGVHNQRKGQDGTSYGGPHRPEGGNQASYGDPGTMSTRPLPSWIPPGYERGAAGSGTGFGETPGHGGKGGEYLSSVRPHYGLAGGGGGGGGNGGSGGDPGWAGGPDNELATGAGGGSGDSHIHYRAGYTLGQRSEHPLPLHDGWATDPKKRDGRIIITCA